MGDVPSQNPETTPATDAKDKEAPKELSFSDLMDKGLTASIYDFIGGDKELLNYDQKYPDLLKSAASTFGHTEEEITDETARQKLGITEKIGILLFAEFKEHILGEGSKTDATEGQGADKVAFSDLLKDKGSTFTFDAFRKYWEKSAVSDGPLFVDGSPHAMWPEGKLSNVLNLFVGTQNPGKLEDWPKIFPYPAGSRIVLQEDPTKPEELGTIQSSTKAFFDKAGLKLTVIKEGDPVTPPAANEVQILSMKNEDPKSMNWDTIQKEAKWWSDKTPTQFSGCSNTLAAIQVLEDNGPVFGKLEDLCKKVGIDQPSKELLDFLGTASGRASVAPAAAPVA